ncbi:hypothetical protein GCM10011390_27440 [Aureimonas endophytica]|uniref:Putative restriction endonuclease domain-containing protein n=1 Tax=Aureimonas endophytica TaxID=2027858 RepID=A0A917E5M0_9HYPH|nr:Uma2 family endonuclease [Aureimonas endophytica]GGE06854.1 hypothetical protein GCM10011390_27440 [Aureimonas endophytica]
MNALDVEPWTVERFFAWQEDQEERFELVDGVPLMLAGASQRHDMIAVNVIARLSQGLHGKTGRTFTGHHAVRTGPGRIRRPTVGVDCGRPDPNDYLASAPAVIFEVLSRSTRSDDQLRKLEEYQAIPSLRHLVFVDTLDAVATHWHRPAEGEWKRVAIQGPLGAIELDAIAVTLLMEDVYEGVTFD